MSRPRAKTPPRKIPQRRRIFLGCEGESERGYGGVLQWFLDESGARVHLDLVTLEPGGDPLALVERARYRIDERRRKRGDYEKHAVLLDDDQLGQNPDRVARIDNLARSSPQIILLWQRPCHEAVLLRHLPGCAQRRPTRSADAIDELRRLWPGYVKGLSAMEISRRIGDNQIRQAMTAEPALSAFLRSLGGQ